MKTLLINTLAVCSLMALPSGLIAGDGAELWMKNCRKCHGEEGKGDTPMGSKFGVRDYTDPAVQADMTDEEIHSAIVDGVKNEDGRPVMMAFGKKLSGEEVDTLVQYVRSLAKAE